MPTLDSLTFSTDFLDSLRGLSSADQGRIFRALALLDENERHPSLNVHELKGQQVGLWTAYATRSLRIVFRRIDTGRKELLSASQHYGD